MLKSKSSFVLILPCLVTQFMYMYSTAMQHDVSVLCTRCSMQHSILDLNKEKDHSSFKGISQQDIQQPSYR